MKEPDGPDFRMSMLDLKDLRKNQDTEKMSFMKLHLTSRYPIPLYLDTRNKYQGEQIYGI